MSRNNNHTSYSIVPNAEETVMPVAVAVNVSATMEKEHNVEDPLTEHDNPTLSTDDYFHDDGDIVTVFDYDDKNLREFREYESVTFISVLLAFAIGIILFWLLADDEHRLEAFFALLVGLFLYTGCVRGWFRAYYSYVIRMNDVPQQHIAVTHTGIRLAQEGIALNMNGDWAVNIPFDDIESINVSIINEGGWAHSVVAMVSIGTTEKEVSSYVISGIPIIPKKCGCLLFEVVGLRDPHCFKRLVDSMQRSGGADPTLKQYVDKKLENLLDNQALGSETTRA